MHRKTREHILCNAVGWRQQHQIGEEAPAVKRLKSICTAKCVELAAAASPVEEEHRGRSQGGKCDTAASRYWGAF